jgi:hypothetical protein
MGAFAQPFGAGATTLGAGKNGFFSGHPMTIAKPLAGIKISTSTGKQT